MKKKIKITTRGRVLTSRGFITTPTRPFLEDTRYFLKMIAKGANVIEILKDGREIVLTEQNFDSDNSAVEPIVEVVEKREPEPITEKTIISKNMSRKERRQAEFARKNNSNQEQSEQNHTVSNSDSTTDVDDAIETE